MKVILESVILHRLTIKLGNGNVVDIFFFMFPQKIPVLAIFEPLPCMQQIYFQIIEQRVEKASAAIGLIFPMGSWERIFTCIYRGLSKSPQAAKITPYYSHFACCSQMCSYEHILSEGQYGWLCIVMSYLILFSISK